MSERVIGFREAFDDYVTLYESAIPIRRLSPLKNQTYTIFRKSGYDIRVVDIKKSFKVLSRLSKIEHFTTGDENYFYIIPIQTVKGNLIGFVFRKLFSSSYASILKNFFYNYPNNPDFIKVPNMFGFKDFVSYDESIQLPIIVCEGMKDAMVLKQFYPYVLSNNTNMMGICSYILKNITNKFILSYDNDEAGNEGYQNDRKTLVSEMCFVDRIKIPEAYKDISDWYSEEGIKPIKEQVKNRVKYLMMN